MLEISSHSFASLIGCDLPKEIFRACDIRGIVHQTFTPALVFRIGQAFGTWVRRKNEHTVLIGRDGRLSGPLLSTVLIQGIQSTGCNVVDIGSVPTPVLYFGTRHFNIPSAIMVTASHNPAEYNGLKMVLSGQPLYGDAILALKREIEKQEFLKGSGELTQAFVLPAYIQAVKDQISLRSLKIVVDCGNGITGNVAPLLYQTLGCEVIPLYEDVNGTFPNHPADPVLLENLTDLRKAVVAENADLGLAFDGDGDRLGVVDNRGNVIWPDRYLLFFIQDVLSRHPGTPIVYDVKCSRHVTQRIVDHGGKPIMWKTGHSLMKAKMQEMGALLAGEMSGHIFFHDRWSGFDDALYAGARLLELLSKEEKDAAAWFATLPEEISTQELRIPLPEEKKFIVMEQLVKKHQFHGAPIITLDGLRVEFPKGWGIIRASNTNPYLIARFEAQDKETLHAIQAAFKEQLLAVDAKLQIPF